MILVAFVAALAATPLVRFLARLTGDIDQPVGMKIHARATPLMGGLAVYVAFAVACLLAVPRTSAVVGVLIGGGVAVGVGVIDEFVSLDPKLHLIGQIVAALAAIVGGVRVVGYISLPFARLTDAGLQVPAALGLVITLLWIVGMMNTVNFLDGLDGLAPGVVAIAVFFLAAWGWDPARFSLPLSAHREELLLPLALGGALLGFLPYNWRPASIFLGDSGALFLGLALASLAIVGPAKLATALLVLLIPVLDVAWAIVRRRLRGRSFLAGDKQHVYHRMLELGVGYTTTVMLLYGICFALGVIDLLLVKQWKLLAFVILAGITAGLFVYLEVRAGAEARRRLEARSSVPAPRQE